MKMSQRITIEPARLGDHPVLDFLNTTPMIEGQLQDSLQSDADVLKMLRRLGWPTKFKGGGLLDAARDLREEIRRIVESRKAGKPLALATLNTFLSEARSHLEINSVDTSAYAIHRIWEQQTPQQTLAPVAEAAADLLATGDFRLIRRCESESCVLWFYDRTRSHRRRWCSMASCGNRHKVAAFRNRASKV
jgi:predicted RNA-binding Zn ribbon-like protein